MVVMNAAVCSRFSWSPRARKQKLMVDMWGQSCDTRDKERRRLVAVMTVAVCSSFPLSSLRPGLCWRNVTHVFNDASIHIAEVDKGSDDLKQVEGEHEIEHLLWGLQHPPATDTTVVSTAAEGWQALQRSLSLTWRNAFCILQSGLSSQNSGPQSNVTIHLSHFQHIPFFPAYWRSWLQKSEHCWEFSLEWRNRFTVSIFMINGLKK